MGREQNSIQASLGLGADLEHRTLVLNNQVINTAIQNHNYNFLMIWKKIFVITEEDKNQVLNFMDTISNQGEIFF